TSSPSPPLAFFLGLIPGVGAWYNGQFVKGFIHVVIFVLLIVAADNISGFFGLLIAFFICYMAFDAYKTAEAIQKGLPMPDPLGLERMFGIQEHHQPSVSSSPAAGGTAVPLATEPPPPAVQRSNEPIGAIVLIVLGVLFLLSNITRFDMLRFWPLILIGIGLWIGYKRTSGRA